MTLLLTLLIPLAFVSCSRETANAEKATGVYVAAVDAYAREHYDEALEYARESLRLDAEFYQARFLEGKILFFLDRREEAGGVFAQLADRYPEYTEARIWHLRCLVLAVSPDQQDGAGLIKKAQAALDRELSFNSTDWRVLYLYALLAGNTGDWEKRLSMGRRAEAALGDSAKVYLDMALTWNSLGLEERAELFLEKARAVSTEKTFPYTNLNLKGD